MKKELFIMIALLVVAMFVVSACSSGEATRSSSPRGTLVIEQEVGWDLSKFNYDELSINTQNSNPEDIFFSLDGTKMYEISSTSNKLYQYSCSDAWDLGSCYYETNVNVSEGPLSSNNFKGLFFNSYGDMLYLVNNQVITKYNLFTPWDLNGGITENLTEGYQNPKDIFMQDNHKFILAKPTDPSGTYQVVYHYFNNVYQNRFIFWDTDGIDDPQALFFSSDGIKMYVVGKDSRNILQYSLNSPWSFSGSLDHNNISHMSTIRGPGGYVIVDPKIEGLYINPSGTKLYVVDSSSNKVYQYSITNKARGVV